MFLDWFYIYSQRYYPFHFYLQDKIPSSIFHPQGIFVDQSVFDEHLYKHEGEHFFSRITVKVETILRLIEQRLDEHNPSPFFFTDCDILVMPQSAIFLAPYSARNDVDMVFQKEMSEKEIVNPGVMLIWPTVACLEFWRSVLNDMRQRITMEMESINTFLQEKKIKWDTFDIGYVSSSLTIKNINTLCIFHILCDCKSREIDIGDKMHEASLFGINMEPYIQKTRDLYGRIFM